MVSEDYKIWMVMNKKSKRGSHLALILCSQLHFVGIKPSEFTFVATSMLIVAFVLLHNESKCMVFLMQAPFDMYVGFFADCLLQKNEFEYTFFFFFKIML